MHDEDGADAQIQALALSLGFVPLELLLPHHDEIVRDGRLFAVLHRSPVGEHYARERRVKRITRDEYRASSNRTMAMIETDGRAATTDPAVPDETHDAHIALLERVQATPAWADLVAQRQSGALDDRACLTAWYALIDTIAAAE